MARRKAGIGEELPEVNFSDYNGVRCLHLGTEWVQGSMKLDDPYEIELEYVQRMMAPAASHGAWPRAMRCSWGWARARSPSSAGASCA